MEKPRFRPRVLPWPREGDNVHLMGFHMSAVPGVVTAVDYGERTFNVNTDGTERGHWLAFDDARWNFADPAVEAKRLQEAAWRADTSPFPEWLQETVKMQESSPPHLDVDRIWRSAVASGHISFYHPSESFSHILRWQAQQEGGKP